MAKLELKMMAPSLTFFWRFGSFDSSHFFCFCFSAWLCPSLGAVGTAHSNRRAELKPPDVTFMSVLWDPYGILMGFLDHCLIAQQQGWDWSTSPGLLLDFLWDSEGIFKSFFDDLTRGVGIKRSLWDSSMIVGLFNERSGIKWPLRDSFGILMGFLDHSFTV